MTVVVSCLRGPRGPSLGVAPSGSRSLLTAPRCPSSTGENPLPSLKNGSAAGCRTTARDRVREGASEDSSAPSLLLMGRSWGLGVLTCDKRGLGQKTRKYLAVPVACESWPRRAAKPVWLCSLLLSPEACRWHWRC